MSAAAASRAGLRGLLAPGLAGLVVLAVLLGLGFWQLERKSWKEALLAQIQARAFATPGEVAPERDWSNWRAAEDEFRRVKVEGVFEHGKGVAVHGLMTDKPGRPVQGFYVVTPLRRDDGSVILVNRGFVIPPLKEEALRPGAEPQGRVAVTGLVRASEARSWFVPANSPGGWFVRDIGEIAKERGLDRVAPFLLDADATPNPGGWPRGGQTRIALPNNHLQYALTWFGLALTEVAVFAAFARRRWRGSGHELQAEDPGHDQRDAAQA